MFIERWKPRSSLARGQPSGTGFNRLERQFDDMFGQFLQDFPTFAGQAGARIAAPALDVIDRPDEVVVRADLPGLEQKDIHVEIQDGTLSLRGERTEQHVEKQEDYYCAERWEGAFNRSIALPPGVDADHVNAKFKSGVLEVHLPKNKEMKGRRVEIKAG